MSGIVHSERILGGSLSGWIAHRQAMIEEMAADLIRLEAPLDNDRDAIAVLVGNGWKAMDIALVVEKARVLAALEVTAREMGES